MFSFGNPYKPYSWIYPLIHRIPVTTVTLLFGVGFLHNKILKGGMVIPLIFPNVPQSPLGIFRVPQLHPPLERPPLKNPTNSRVESNLPAGRQPL